MHVILNVKDNKLNSYYNGHNNKTLADKKQISFNGETSSLSKISPEMIGININSVNLDMKNFLKIISRYSYGKKSLIYNPENFKISEKDDDIYLDDFHQPDKNLKEGICEELTYKAGKELQEKYGDKYIFFAVKGIYLPYNMGHYYITAVNRTPQNEKSIQKMFKKTNKMALLVEDLKKSKNCDEIIIKTNKIQDEINKVNVQQKEILDGAILIDPSFHIVKKYSSEGIVDNYDNGLFCDFETMNPFKDSSYKITKKLDGAKIPLGFVKDIAPDLNINQDDLLWLCAYSPIAGILEAKICTIDDENILHRVNLEKNHVLSKFIQKGTEDVPNFLL